MLGGEPSPNPDDVRGYSDHYGVLTAFELVPSAAPGMAPATPAAQRSPLRTLLAGSFGQGMEGNRKQRRKASLVAAAASLSSFAILRKGGPGGGAGRVLTTALLAALLVAGGVNLSTAARLETESRTHGRHDGRGRLKLRRDAP